jgi:hypothetical protein
MNIVFLIGNGFDLNLGMKTSYRDFYNYYQDLPTTNDSNTVKSFKEALRRDGLELWSDLELALGVYLGQLNAKEAVELHDHLINYLSQYIALEEAECPVDEKQKNVFWQYLRSPHGDGRLLPVEADEISTYYSRWDRKHWDIKIITFNYTRSIEKITGSIDKSIQIGTRSVQGYTPLTISLSGIEHIHGFSDERMTLGVNDISQMANDKLRLEMDVITRYIKSDHNRICYLGHDEKCQQWLHDAHHVCLFGLSFGETDKKWWVQVGATLCKGCKVILFAHSKKGFSGNQKAHLFKAKEDIKDRFLSQADIDGDLKATAKENIYVAYNTDMFKFDI